MAVLVLNAAGEIYVHRRAPGGAGAPGLLDVFVSGGAGAGESADGAARRQVREWLGIAGAEPALLFALDLAGEDRARVWIYRLELADPPAPDQTMIGWGDFLPLDSVAALLGSGHLQPPGEVLLRAAMARHEPRAPGDAARAAALPPALAFHCIHCGEPNTVPVDLAGGYEQDLIEDCQICCAPNRLRIAFDLETLAPSVEVGEA